ncbi:LOW QUALITY PROTEIN: unconventional myosin-IXAa [Cyprinodon tularosa]|uniref:LOW QUALITY PROTEIN: unconventional myosin-IXAa n=1 Tax=Cyprinodon tularosa TaxID=77115 RepID=UPI0018E21BB1|nr:LOW QUALITY PROTEIN: unconventional myosin-IXAa [Cyprinodon tularosa]
MSARDGVGGVGMGTLGRRHRFENSELTVRIYPGALAEGTIYCPISARKTTTAHEAIERVIDRLQLDRTKCYVLAEVKEFGGEEWILNPNDCPVQRMMLWPRVALEHRPLSGGEDYRFLLRQKNLDGSIHYENSLQMWLQVTEERRRMVERGLLPQPHSQGDHADLCCLPELNEHSLLDNLRLRFRQEKIYTYVGSILIVINPFKFLPIYNPKYVKMYDNHTLGDLEPHIYAVADVAYHTMLRRQRNQCIVISGESGSGKTQSTNFLIHHLTALSQKGFASGVEQIILGAGPVLEAFGNAKTAHNNNSSRFGKFIQVNYQESGTVRGAYVEKYLLEKSRLVNQEPNERNYHVFYYLLAGASEEERRAFHLKKPEEYHYLSQMTKTSSKPRWDSYCDESEPDCFTVEGEDLKHDFERLQLAMEMVGFLPATRKQIFSLLSAILHLGNIRYKKKTYRDDSIDICNPEVLPVVSELLEVREDMLFEALTTRKTVTVGEKLIVPYKLAEAGTVRDSMAKSLYSALFDWIVFRINHALLNIKDLEETTKILSIGVLDIFGFEDFENNSFEQFCINFANERLQHYFNQHIFKLEQEEYRAEGISWMNIDYIDNTGCINLVSKKPTALFHLLDEECNFPQATNQTLLDKFKRQHEGNSYIEFPAVMEPAFIIRHYAGKVKYGVKDFREKNTDHMRPDIVALLKSSKNAFICSLIGIDPSATFRWAVLRAYFRALVAFREAGKRHTHKKTGHDDAAPCAVLKKMDSFSFLQHPVHQRSLEILQRCKEEKYTPDESEIVVQSDDETENGETRRTPRMPLSDIQGSNTIIEKSPRSSPGLGWNGRVGRRSRLPSSGSNTEEDGIFVNSASSRLLERAHDILMRNKNYKLKPVLPKHLLNVKSLKYLSNLTLHDRITKSLLHLHKKKKPPSISAQFQASLNKLMETLGQSEPYFVKCIRSNADKLPLRFDDKLVLRQLRYTGMLETVRIRQSGYNVKYTFKDFVHHFGVLLPEDTSPTRESIQESMSQLDLQPEGYQVGKTKVFLREAERQRLQAELHREVLRLIVMLQQRFRARLERKQFVRMREAAVYIQKCWRSYRSMKEEEKLCDPGVQQRAALCVQTHWRGYRGRQKFRQWREAARVLQRAWRFWICRRTSAAVVIQTAWRCHQTRASYLRLYAALIQLQAVSRGFLSRQSFRKYKEQRLKEEEKEEEKLLQNGQVNISSAEEEKELPEEIMGLDLSTWEDRSYEQRERSLQLVSNSETAVKEEEEQEKAEAGSSEVQTEANTSAPISSVAVQERVRRRLEEPSQKTTRSKRECRRMRELEQAKFSLELQKVRASSGGASSPSEDRRWSLEFPPASPALNSPQGTPDSESFKYSFEIPVMDGEPPKAAEEIDNEDPFSPVPPIAPGFDSNMEDVSSSVEPPEPYKTQSTEAFPQGSQSPTKMDPPAASHPPKMQNYLPTFYLPARQSSTFISHPPAEESLPNRDVTTATASNTNPCKERQGSSRRPVLVVISMQKETPLSEELSPTIRPPVELGEPAIQTGDSPPPSTEEAPRTQGPLSEADQTTMNKLVRLNEATEERRRNQQQQNEKEMMEQIRRQSEVLEQQRMRYAQCEKEMFEKQRGEALQRIQQSRQGRPDSARTSSSFKGSRPSSLLIEKTSGQVPHGRTQSDSTPPPPHSPVTVTAHGSPKLPQLPPPPFSAPTERRRDHRPAAEGWAPKLTLESRNGSGVRMKAADKKPEKQEGTTVNLADKPGNIFFFPNDKVTFPTSDADAVFKEPAVPVPREGPTPALKFSKGIKARDVSSGGPKKKARMARTRSDFLTRASSLAAAGDSDEDDYDGDSLTSPRHYTLPLSKQTSTEAGRGEACFSDSDMPLSPEEQKKIHKAMSSGDLGKVESLRKNSQDGRVRGRMRFWGKSKYGDKKTSREKLICGAESIDGDYGESGPLLGDAGQENMSPPCSPDLTLDRSVRDLKENKEASPKVKHRRSVKISSVALEPAQWQNDALQILSCINDYLSMNDFLLKKINDLETEDSKKDTMVDVVFKKALKEFRLNIFNFFSTALVMDDSKDIRYKDLYALFEQILEKTMRQEQRDWRESPVKVWVNTFKVFLDEFMTEYKLMDSTLSKPLPRPQRKKPRKKDTDIVEEHNGHIFKSTQYSIPTYCEYCSSLIWMMERACVCKLCRYACHRKCCQKTTTKCSKKLDPELSSRQFGVEVSRLTNDERTVPLVVEKLINHIEMHGLYTEGIYRKSGSTNKIKELKLGLDNDVENMNLDDYNIHVIASVFKQWLRDLPNPLMTFELYEEFIRAMSLQDKKETIRGVYSVIDQLSRTHLNTLERLIFHLVRISLEEETNRMSANALAIVFAPCILRCPDTTDPLRSVQDISRTTACVELIICEQMTKYKVRLKDISTLEFAENKAKTKLSLIRRSMGKGHRHRLIRHTPSPPASPRLSFRADVAREDSGGEEGAEPLVDMTEQAAMQQEDRVLTEQIENLQKKKEELTVEMLALEPRASDDETLESEASIGTADSSENLNLDSEDTISDFSERGPRMSSPWPRRADGKDPRRRTQAQLPDSLDSTDSCSTVSSYSSSSHFQPSPSSAATRRFRLAVGSSLARAQPQPLNTSQSSRSDSFDGGPAGEQDAVYDEQPQFTSRGTYNPEKGRQKLKGARRNMRDNGGGPSRDPPDIPQHLVLYGSKEFMV